MGGVPYALPGVFPANGGSGWDQPLLADLEDIKTRIQQHEASYGVLVDAFPGGTDDAKLQAAMSYAAQQTRPPALLLSNRAYSFSGGPYPYYNGMRLVGSLGTTEREFQSTGPQCLATISGSAFLSVPSGGAQNIWISGIQFRAASGSVSFQTPVTDFSNGPILQDVDYRNLAWVGFKNVLHARHLRASIERTYTNNGTDTQFKLAGSDNFYWTEGKSYISAHALTAAMYYVYFTHMSRTSVGPLYITPEVATGVRIDGSYGNLVFRGTLFDSTGRTSTTACQGAALLITGGKGMVFDTCWFFNNAVNPSSTGRSPVDKGQVFIRGSAAELLFTGCQWGGGDAQTVVTPAGTPAIYAATGVTNVKVSNPIAPNGGNKLLQHQSSGIITTTGAADWTLSVA